MAAFWQTLPKPFLALAPLDGVTDTVFRTIVAGCSRPDVFFTEFTSADGYCSDGKASIMDNLRFTKEELPLIAQIWGNNPDTIYRLSAEVARMGFTGIDINMGCPVRTVMKAGCGAAMIKTPEVAKAVIRAARDGIASSGNIIPLSVKTRIGASTISTDTWIPFLLEQELDALTVHGRTAAELSKVPAHWDEIGKAVGIRNRMGVKTVIIGNGDVADAAQSGQKSMEFGVDGVMIGRGIFTNLWAFDRSAAPHNANWPELFDLMEKHIRLFGEVWGQRKHFATLNKFFKIYVKGFAGAAEARDAFMKTASAEEALTLMVQWRRRASTEDG
jgi:tRNA-dihydrouridine synthase